MVDQIHPGATIDQIVSQLDEPPPTPNIFMGYHNYKAAQLDNVRILFEGHDGDTAISHGYGLFPELLKKGKFIRAYKEVYHRCGNKKQALSYLKYISKELLKQTVIPNQTNKGAESYLVKYFNTSYISKINLLESLQERSQLNKAPTEDEWQQHIKSISHPIHQLVLEFLNIFSSRFNLESVFPFFDHRLIDFCIHLPPEIKLHNGFNRYILRLALKNILPRSIENRKDKVDFIPSIDHAFRSNDYEWLLKSINSTEPPFFQYLDKQRWNEITNDYIQGTSGRHTNFILKALFLNKWLFRFK